jgi:hypothetical protein
MAFNFGKTQVHASVKATRLLLIKTPPARRTRIQYERATDSIPQHRTRRQAICHHQVPPFRRAVRLNGAINPRDRAADDLRLLPFHCPFADGQTASVHHTRTWSYSSQEMDQQATDHREKETGSPSATMDGGTTCCKSGRRWCWYWFAVREKHC